MISEIRFIRFTKSDTRKIMVRNQMSWYFKLKHFSMIWKIFCFPNLIFENIFKIREIADLNSVKLNSVSFVPMKVEASTKKDLNFWTQFLVFFCYYSSCILQHWYFCDHICRQRTNVLLLFLIKPITQPSLHFTLFPARNWNKEDL